MVVSWNRGSMFIFLTDKREFHQWGGNTVAAGKRRQVLQEEEPLGRGGGSSLWYHHWWFTSPDVAKAVILAAPVLWHLSSLPEDVWLSASYPSATKEVNHGRCPEEVFFQLKSEIVVAAMWSLLFLSLITSDQVMLSLSHMSWWNSILHVTS